MTFICYLKILRILRIIRIYRIKILRMLLRIQNNVIPKTQKDLYTRTMLQFAVLVLIISNLI